MKFKRIEIISNLHISFESGFSMYFSEADFLNILSIMTKMMKELREIIDLPNEEDRQYFELSIYNFEKYCEGDNDVEVDDLRSKVSKLATQYDDPPQIPSENIEKYSIINTLLAICFMLDYISEIESDELDESDKREVCFEYACEALSCILFVIDAKGDRHKFEKSFKELVITNLSEGN